MAEIPIEIWRQIGKAPTLREHHDQGYEAGFVPIDGMVHRYSIDRREQADELRGSWVVEDFLTTERSPERVAWAREARKAG